MNIINILTILLLGLFPLCFYLIKYKKVYENKKSYIIATLSTLFAGVVSVICLQYGKLDIHIPSLLSGAILNFILAKNLANENIKTKNFIKFTITLTIFFFKDIFGYIPITLLNITENSISTALSIYISSFSDAVAAIILILMYYDNLKKGIKEAKKNFNQFFDANLKIWIFGFIGMMVSNLFIQLFVPSAVAGNENAVQSMIDISPLVMLLTAGVIAPIVEELTFRQAFQDIIKNKTVFILVSGIVFGLLHVIFSYQSITDFLYVIPYSSLGISFAYMVSKSDNIFSSIFMHFLHNTAIISLSILTGMMIL